MILPELTTIQTYALMDALSCFLATADHWNPPTDITATGWFAEIQAAYELEIMIDERTMPATLHG
jgi:hypothetical protein